MQLSKEACGVYHSPFDIYPKKYFMGDLEIPMWSAMWMLSNGHASIISEEKKVGCVRVNLKASE